MTREAQTMRPPPVDDCPECRCRPRKRQRCEPKNTNNVNPARSRSILFRMSRSVLGLTSLLLLAVRSTEAATPCIRFADHTDINALFSSGGPGTVVQLCPSTLYRLSGAIVFTAADQELTTSGQPTDDTRATIRIQGNGETAVQGDCRRCKGVKVRNLIIDGNRRKLRRSAPTEEAGALIILGGNEGQVLQDCTVRDPRGLTAVHVREGSKVDCSGASIVGNTIGPVGEEYDPKKDGEDPEMSPLGRPLADAISIACRDSEVKGNTIFDSTASGIIIYGSPGTIVENNTITTNSVSAMAGILMVDAAPFDGDYTGLIVRQNTISAEEAAIRIGIGIGPTVWSDDTETVLRGGSVIENTLSGSHMGYGIAAAGLDGWKILDNVDEADYEGQRGPRCFEETINPEPMAFLYTEKTVKNSQIQEDFVDAHFEYAACIDPIRSASRTKGRKGRNMLHPNRAKKVTDGKKLNEAKKKTDTPVVTHADDDDPEDDSIPEIKTKEPVAEHLKASSEHTEDSHLPESEVKEAELEAFDTGSVMMDNILDHSRTRLLDAIHKLEQRIEDLSASRKAGSQDPEKAAQQSDPEKQSQRSESAIIIDERVEALEKDQSEIVDQARRLRMGMQKWNQDLVKEYAWEHELLLDIQSRLNHHFLIHPVDNFEITPGEHHDYHAGHEANQAALQVPHDQAGRESKERGNLRQRSERARLLSAMTGEKGGLGGGIFLVCLAVMLGLGVMAWRRLSARRDVMKRGHTTTLSGSGPYLGQNGATGSGSPRKRAVRGWGTSIWKDSHRKEM